MGVTKLPFGHRPLMLYNGEVSCQTLTGKISIMRLQTHIFSDDQGISEDEVTTGRGSYIHAYNTCTLLELLHTCSPTVESINATVHRAEEVRSFR